MGNSLSVKRKRTKNGNVEYEVGRRPTDIHDADPTKLDWRDYEYEIRRERVKMLPIHLVSSLLSFVAFISTLFPMIEDTFIPYLLSGFIILGLFYSLARNYWLLFAYGVVMILYCGIVIVCSIILFFTRSKVFCSVSPCEHYDLMMVFYALLIFGLLITIWYLIQGIFFWRRMARLLILMGKSGYPGTKFVSSEIGATVNMKKRKSRTGNNKRRRRKKKKRSKSKNVSIEKLYDDETV